MRLRYLIFAFLFLWLMTSCAPDPRKQAKAKQIQEQAQQDALNQEQNRIQAMQIHDLQIQAEQLELDRTKAIELEKRTGLRTMTQWGFIFGTACLCFVIFKVSQTFVLTTQQIAAAAAHAAEVKSNLIYLDDKGQFPALIQHVGKGVYSLTDLNTETVLMLDSRNPGDRQMIAGAIAIRHTGVLADRAAKSNDAAGMSLINPPIILDVESK